jgi:hypothetical protein
MDRRFDRVQKILMAGSVSNMYEIICDCDLDSCGFVCESVQTLDDPLYIDLPRSQLQMFQPCCFGEVKAKFK